MEAEEWQKHFLPLFTSVYYCQCKQKSKKWGRVHGVFSSQKV